MCRESSCPARSSTSSGTKSSIGLYVNRAWASWTAAEILSGGTCACRNAHAHGWIADVEFLQPVPPVNNTKAWLDNFPPSSASSGRSAASSPRPAGTVPSTTVVSCPVLEVDAAERVDEDRDIVVAGDRTRRPRVRGRPHPGTPIGGFLNDLAAEGPRHRNCSVNLDNWTGIVQT